MGQTCQVEWRNHTKCSNPATHWACATDTSRSLFKVCALCAQSVRNLVYTDQIGYRLKGEPLWVCQEMRGAIL